MRDLKRVLKWMEKKKEQEAPKKDRTTKKDKNIDGSYDEEGFLKSFLEFRFDQDGEIVKKKDAVGGNELEDGMDKTKHDIEESHSHSDHHSHHSHSSE